MIFEKDSALKSLKQGRIRAPIITLYKADNFIDMRINHIRVALHVIVDGPLYTTQRDTDISLPSKDRE